MKRLRIKMRWNRNNRVEVLVAALVLTVLAVGGLTAVAQSAVPVVTGDARVDKLLSHMPLDEKLALIRGASEDPTTNQGQAGYLTGVPRLGIPPIRLSDGPPGVLTRVPSQLKSQPWASLPLSASKMPKTTAL